MNPYQQRCFKGGHNDSESSTEFLDLVLPRHGFIGSSPFSLETVEFQQSLRAHLPELPVCRGDVLGPTLPNQWSLLRVASLPASVQAEITDLAQALRENASRLNRRYQISHPRPLGDSPRFGVVGIFADGSKSSFFYNLPPLAHNNRCAEQGLVSDIVNKLSQGIKVLPLKSIILVGLASADGSRLFRLHPNFCSPCRTSLAELIPFGIIDLTTEILSFSITLAQGTPQLGRRSTFGSLVPHQAIDFMTEDASFFISPKLCIDDLCAAIEGHLQGDLSKREVRQLRQYFGQIITEDGVTEERAILVARRVRDRKLLFYGLKSSFEGNPMTDGRVQYASAATIATLSCLASRNLLSKPIIIDILPLRRPVNHNPSQYLNPYSSSTNQRRLDFLHHELMNCWTPTKIIQVLSKAGSYYTRELDPASERPLVEGIIYRGRTSLTALPDSTNSGSKGRPSSELQFSSQLVYCTRTAAELVGSTEPQLLGNRQSYHANKRLKSKARKTFSVDTHERDLCRFCFSSNMRQITNESDKKPWAYFAGELFSSLRLPEDKGTPDLESVQNKGLFLKALLEGAAKLNNENALHNMRAQQLIAAYAIGINAEGRQVQVASSPSLSLFADSSHPHPLFNLCAQIVIEEITPKEIHVGKRHSFTLQGLQYADLLQLIISDSEDDFPIYIHNFQLVREGKQTQTSTELRTSNVRSYSARQLTFPVR